MNRLPSRKLIAAVTVALALAGGAVGAAASSAAGATSTSTTPTSTVPTGDWLTFNYSAQRYGVGPADTGITPANVHHLHRLTVHIDGTADSSAVALAGANIDGGAYDAFFVTTSYGHTLAINAANGKTLWEFAPASLTKLEGSGQFTSATPVIDPDLEYIYVATPDGFIHKLSIATGRQVWSTRMTWDPTHEKLASSLNIADGELIVATDGYYGDVPPYEGHVVTINMQTGRRTHIWNSLCSNLKGLIDPPSKCGVSDSAIWGRPGTVVVPSTGDILVTTGNGPFNGHTDWGDSVLKLSPSLKLLHNWTPVNQEQLNTSDWDLGSTEPALLPDAHGPQLAVQAGKEGLVRLLNLNRLDGTTRHAGPKTGGELQTVDAPGPTDVYSQPAVYADGSRTYVYVTDADGTAAFRFIRGRLHPSWQDKAPGTSPVIAGGLLYVYDEIDGVLDVRNPVTGHLYAALPAEQGHWNSPIVVGGRIILPEGNADTHPTTGTIDIYSAPGT